MDKLTTDQIEAKAAELSEKFQNKVTPIVITSDDEQIIGYLQEPSYDVLMYAFDMYIVNQAGKATEAAIKDCLIADASDQRITSSARKDAKIKASFTIACMKVLNPLLDEYKKK